MDDTLREDWETLVGRFMLICGDLELALLQLHWNMHVERDDFESIRNAKFSDKVKKIHEALKACEMLPDLRGEIENLLSKISNLMSKRNLIAHNPLFLDVFEKEDRYTFERKICSLRDKNKHITLSRLEKEIKTAQDISNELFGVLSSDFHSNKQ